MKNKNIIKYIAGLLVFAGAGYFFVAEFYKHYDSITKFEFNIRWPYLIAAQLLLIGLSLAGTYSWKILLEIIVPQKITFLESIAVVNTSQLTKYLPGKVWSYALQMLLLAKRGVSKTMVLYINMFLMITSLLASAFLGLLYLACFSLNDIILWYILLSIFFVFYLAFIFLNQRCLNIIIKIVQKLFKKTIEYTPLNVGWIVIFQITYLLINALFGLTGYLLALGLGFPVGIREIFAIAASLIIADLIGFIVLIAPGGLGVRESIMYALLGVLGDKNLALILPLGTRIIGMISDLLLGGLGFFFLKKQYKRKDNR